MSLLPSVLSLQLSNCMIRSDSKHEDDIEEFSEDSLCFLGSFIDLLTLKPVTQYYFLEVQSLPATFMS